MVSTPPLASSAALEPRKRPQPIPAKVRKAIGLMVFGAEDDTDCKPLGMIDAAKASGLEPYHLRRYLDRPTVRAFLQSERRAFREAICAGNELALLRVRDQSKNGMVTVAAVRTLEELQGEARAHPADAPRPGVTIVIHPAPSPPPIDHPDAPLTIDVTPTRDSQSQGLDD